MRWRLRGMRIVLPFHGMEPTATAANSLTIRIPGFETLGDILDGMHPRTLHRVTVFTGSAVGASHRYTRAAQEFARAVVTSGSGIVYGGGKVGLMGVVADSALRAGGEVIGVMPESLVQGEIGHLGLTELEVVSDMHTRKTRMADLSDGFVALPGGAGTLEELFEIWTWQQLGIHTKPVGLYNVDGFWQPLLQMLDHMTEQGFISTRFRQTLVVEDEPTALMDAMSSWQPLTAKWPAPKTTSDADR